VTAPIEWGVKPLPEQERFAALVREVTSQMLSLEQSGPALDNLLAALEAARDDLEGLLPSEATPRIGERQDGDGRVFIDHCRDIGGFNPMFPVYEIVVAGPESASGSVNFPIAYEGPAGCVNGGFLAVFFDEVVQHHNCDLGVSGATRDFDIRYRRPVPLLVDLRFEITREVGRSVYSEVRLLRGDELLCSASTNAVVFDGQSRPVAERRPS
jgi:acyl-coenzyme A thioesterase PaaI-like protein